MRKSKPSLASCLLFLLLISASRGFSQQSMNIAVFDFMKTVDQSKAGQTATSQLKQKEQSYTAELERIDKQIMSFQQRMNTQRLTLSAAALQDLTAKIEGLQIEKKRKGEDYGKEYQNLQYELLDKMKKDVLSVVDQLAKEKEYTIVFELSSSGIAYFNENFDITAEVIKRYDALTEKR
jgi:Skp family chaperone for outer membrane proteins